MAARRTRRAPTRRRRNPSAALTSARRRSRTFSGKGNGDVIALSEKERRLSKYLMPLGTLVDLSYKPLRGKRAGSIWQHLAGDTGKRTIRSRQLVAMDVRSRRAVLVPRGGMRVSSRRGLVG